MNKGQNKCGFDLTFQLVKHSISFLSNHNGFAQSIHYENPIKMELNNNIVV